MTAPVLYRSWANFNVEKFSYSLAKDVDNCGQYTIFSRFQGLAARIDSAALKFGICCEEAIIEHYKTGEDPQRGFALKWLPYRDFTLKYSKNDTNWETLNSVGKALMREFLAQKDTLPFVNPEFGVVIPRDLKQTWYNGTRLEYLADCISHSFEGELLLDIKTSGRSYPESPKADGYPQLDPQLRTGSLASGIRQVGFVVLVKTRYPKIQVHTATIPEWLIAKTDEWLKEQYHKLLDRRLIMRAGVRYPDDHCLNCDFLPKCLGNETLAGETLRQKESKEVGDMFAAFDDE